MEAWTENAQEGWMAVHVVASQEYLSGSLTVYEVHTHEHRALCGVLLPNFSFLYTLLLS